MLQVHWVKSKSDTWLDFQTFNLSSNHGDGVYIIWHTGNPSRVVYVGSGDIAERLQFHRTNSNITQYAKNGTLKVTWANLLQENQWKGAERYFADKLHPLVGAAHPDVLPIAVNSPW